MKFKDIINNLANRINQPHVIEVYLRQVYAKGFVDGTKKSPWISVKDDLPGNKNNVLVRNNKGAVYMAFFDDKLYVWINSSPIFSIVLDVDYWMPIPSFDEILESNKDVLKRTKEKGD